MKDNAIDSINTLDIYCAGVKTNLLLLHLQLAEESKRSGEFKTTYKSESGKEIEVTRSPDGKFASKSGSGSASTASKPNEQTLLEKEKPAGGSVAEIMKNLLNGDAGKQLKKNIVSAIEKNSTVKNAASRIGNAINEANLKTGVQQAKFSEILGSGKDAIGSAQKYIKNEMDEIAKGASNSETWQSIGKTLVAGLVAGACAGGIIAAAGGTATAVTAGVVGAYAATLVLGAVQDSARIGKRNAYNFEHRFEIAAKKDADAKFAAMIERFNDERAQKQLLEDVKTVAEMKRAEIGKSKSGESAEPILDTTNLDAKIKDLQERAAAASEAMTAK